MSEKLKSFLLNDHIFFGFLIILVGITSFGLGRASTQIEPINKQDSNNFSQIETVSVSTTDIISTEEEKKFNLPDYSQTGEFVASKSGTKYHLTSCTGAKQIKLENKIFFSSKADAEAAGYKPASNCPGLQ